MSGKELEWKYSLTEETFKALKERIYHNENIKSIGILQWFISVEDNGYERLRLEIYKEMDTYRHVWTYCKKIKNQKEIITEKERDAENRKEIELTIDMGNYSEKKPDYMSEDAYMIIGKTKKNLSELNKYPAIFKIRHKLNNPVSGFEFILDELVPIDAYTYESISHIVEIEQMDETKTFNLEKILQRLFLPLSSEDMMLHSSEDKTGKSYKNKDIAIKAKEKANGVIPSAQRAISFIENKMSGPVYVIAMQGNSLKAGFGKVLKNKKSEIGKDYAQYINNKDFDKETGKGIKSCAELDSLYMIERDGFKIEKVYYFVFPDIEELNDVRFFDTKSKQPQVYENLEQLTKHFFNVDCEAVSIEYSTQSRKMINNTFGEIWGKIKNIIDAENKSGLGRQIIMEIASGQKYPGIIASMYCMFNQLPFYYKQERSENLVKFPVVPVNWDNVKIDGYNTFLKNIAGRQNNKNTENINYSEYISLPQGIKNLFNFTEEEKTEVEMISLITLSSITDTYENVRKLPFGYGEKLINHIENEEWKEFIVKKIRDKWSLQWIGDQIPETVEHSQRHSKRLMEFTHNLINIIGEDTFLQGVPQNLENEFYFVLAVAMNVHDLGHTNSVWIFENDRKMFLDGLPGVVRDLHNELTVQMLDKVKRGDEFKLLEGIEHLFEGEKRNNILKAIRLVCKYHRGYLRIENQGGKDKVFARIFDLDITPLETVLEKEFTDDNWRKLTKTAAQWLRFIDGTDVQSDRALSRDYTKIRSERTAMEAFNIGQDLLMTQTDYLKQLGLKQIFVDSLEMLSSFENKEGFWKMLGDNGSEIETIFYEELRRIIVRGTDKEFYTVPFELKQVAKFAFKIRQFPHFKKHATVKMVYPNFFREKNPELNEKGKLFITYILEKDDNTLKAQLKEDVGDEFKTALIGSIPGNGVKSLKILVES